MQTNLLQYKQDRKSSLDKITSYIPWKNLWSEYMKLNSNENQYEYDFPFREKLSQMILDEKLQNYPDFNTIKYQENIKTAFGCSAENVIFDNWSSWVLNLIFRAFVEKWDKVATAWPTFILYKMLSDLQQSNYIELPWRSDLSLPTEELINTDAELTIICNPNNPIPRIEIEKVIASAKWIVVVDEAYIEFSNDSVLDIIEKYDNLIVTRTFSKAYWMAWLRIGAWFASKNLIEKIKKVQLPFAVSLINQYAISLILENMSSFEENIKKIRINRDRLTTKLKEAWFEIQESSSNFVLVRKMWYSSEKITKMLEERKVLVRYVWQMHDSKDYFRISIWTKEQMDRFVDILNDVIRKYI